MHGLIIDLPYDRCPCVDLSYYLSFYFIFPSPNISFLLHGGLPGISFLPHSSSTWMGSFFLIIIFSFRDSIHLCFFDGGCIASTIIRYSPAVVYLVAI
jgi:hypothetical protein